MANRFDASAVNTHNPYLMKWIYLLGYLAMPAVVLVHFWIGHTTAGPKSWEPVATFVLAAMAILPLARLMGQATEQLATKTGPTLGGLLNATFGNAAELIIGIIALTRGLNDIAMASLAGSIVGNLLLVGGVAMVVGGWRRERQSFSGDSAEASAGLLAVAVTGMLVPAIFHFNYAGRDAHLLKHEHGISAGTSVILLLVYGLGLLFTLKTHRHLFSSPPGTADQRPAASPGVTAVWPVRKGLLALLVASIGIGLFSEWLVGSVELAAASLHLNYLFVGVILIAIIGNAAEHSTAIFLARNNDMETAMTIVFQSSLQVALFVTPALVLLSAIFVSSGMPLARRMDLIFSPLEVAAVLLSVGIMVLLSRNGQSNWFEGVLLLAVYAILAITFYYIPSGRSEGYDGVKPAGESAAIKDRSHAASRE